MQNRLLYESMDTFIRIKKAIPTELDLKFTTIKIPKGKIIDILFRYGIFKI